MTPPDSPIPQADVPDVLASFEVIEDPRRKQAQRHPLMGILLCSLLYGYGITGE